jgi:hypothetical protein
VALEHTVEMEKLEPNNWRDAAARESGCPSSNNEINFEKPMVVVVEYKFLHANKFKSILVLLSKREIPFHPIPSHDLMFPQCTG